MAELECVICPRCGKLRIAELERFVCPLCKNILSGMFELELEAQVEDKATKKLLLRLLKDVRLTLPKQVKDKDKTCVKCGDKFRVGHQCRLCGDLFCRECALLLSEISVTF